MKKLLIVILSVLLLASLFSCSSGVSPVEDVQSARASDRTGTVSSDAHPTEQTNVPPVRVGVSGVRFPEASVTLAVGQRYAVEAQILPENATDRGIEYTVVDRSVCSYENGALTALSPGSTMLVAVTDEDGYVARLQVTVAEGPVPTEPTSASSATADPTASEDPSTETPDTPTPVTPTPVTPDTPTTATVEPTEKKERPIICIDAGHGFANSKMILDVGAGEGTVYNTLSKERTGTALYEADLNLIIALKVQALLERAGYTVLMLRTDYVNEYLNISKRAERVRGLDVDMLVSIHANAAANPDAHGARVYYNANAGFARTYDSMRLAQSILDTIGTACPASTPAYLVDGQSLAMLNGSGNIPVTLVETCFLTCQSDAENALDTAWQDQMAKAIAEGIISYIIF